jgi:hypothetical protein
MQKKSSKTGKPLRPTTAVELQPFVLEAVRDLPKTTLNLLEASQTRQAMLVSTNTHTAVLYPATIDGLECIYGLDIHGNGNVLGLRQIIHDICMLCRANRRAFAFRARHKKWKRLFEKNGGFVVCEGEDFIVAFPPVYGGNGRK